jgi:hypothetical protein
VIAVSVLFLAAAIATFLVGVFSTGLQMIGASIGCSVAAALLLLVGVMRDSRKRPVVAAGGMSVSSSDVATYVAPSLPEEAEMTPLLESEFANPEPVSLEEAREDFYGTPATESYDDFEPEVAPAPARKPAVRKPAARKPAAKRATARKPAAKKAAPAKAAPKKATARKPAAKSSAKKAAPRKPAARKPTSR